MKLNNILNNRALRDFILFLVLFMILFFIYGLGQKLSMRPQSIHIWRQTDCLSITQNYYQRNNPIWEPEIYNMMGDNHSSGKSAGEFPGLYYVAAMLWKLFGKSEIIYRLLVLLITFSGLFLLLRMNSEILKNRYQALFISLILYTSVIFVSYSFNFLPNLPSFSFILVGWFFIWRFYKKDLSRSLWWAMVFFALGMLLKVSSGISFVALLGWIMLEWIRPPAKRILFRKPAAQIIPFLIPIILVVGWYLYANWYNGIHKAYYTFNDLWPIWKMDYDYFLLIIKDFRIIWFPEFYHWSVWYVTLAMWIYVLATYKKRSFFLNYLAVIIPLGIIIYFLFWFKALRSHDYYYIELYMFFVLTWLLFFKTLNRYKWFTIWPIYVLLAAWLAFNAYNFTERFEDRYRSWMNRWYTEQLQAVGELEPLLREHGVDPDDFVISIPDGSINGTLYLMNQRGFTNYGSDFAKPEGFDTRIKDGAKYLVVSDTASVDQLLIQKYSSHLLFTHKNVFVYDLRPFKE